MLWYGTLAKLMKNIFAKEFLPILKDLMQNLKAIENSEDLSYINSILSYIIQAGEVRDETQFQEIIQTGLTKVDEEQVMTLAELYMQRGIQKGILQGKEEGEQKGEQKALRSFITELLKQNFTLDQIAKLTKLSVAEVKRLKEQIH